MQKPTLLHFDMVSEVEKTNHCKNYTCGQFLDALFQAAPMSDFSVM